MPESRDFAFSILLFVFSHPIGENMKYRVALIFIGSGFRILFLIGRE